MLDIHVGLDVSNINSLLLHKVLTTNQFQYLHHLISVQLCHNTILLHLLLLAQQTGGL